MTTAVLFALPGVFLAIALLAGRFPGEQAITRARERRLRRPVPVRRRRPLVVLAPVPVVLPRPGRQFAPVLAIRPPPLRAAGPQTT